jgi:hypothetical protein
MRRYFSYAITFLVGGAVVAALYESRSRHPATAPNKDHDRAVRIDRPDPTSPTGRKSALLTVLRVTGGPEGTIQYAPIPERVSPSGVSDFDIHDTPLWVVSIGQRSYVLGPRD